MNEKPKPFDHPKLGGKVVNLRRPIELSKIPQRKPNNAMSGDELLSKAVNGMKKS